MRHMNTVFRDVLKLVPWLIFDRLVERHGSDEFVRKLTTRHQLIAFLYGQFAGANSLREIVTALQSHRVRLYHVGGKVPARSTLSDANRDRSYEPFSGLFVHMLGVAAKGVRRKIGEAVRLIDSTGLRLSGVGAGWAQFSAEVCGAKAHIGYDPGLTRDRRYDRADQEVAGPHQ